MPTTQHRLNLEQEALPLAEPVTLPHAGERLESARAADQQWREERTERARRRFARVERLYQWSVRANEYTGGLLLFWGIGRLLGFLPNFLEWIGEPTRRWYVHLLIVLLLVDFLVILPLRFVTWLYRRWLMGWAKRHCIELEDEPEIQEEAPEAEETLDILDHLPHRYQDTQASGANRLTIRTGEGTRGSFALRMRLQTGRPDGNLAAGEQKQDPVANERTTCLLQIQVNCARGSSPAWPIVAACGEGMVASLGALAAQFSHGRTGGIVSTRRYRTLVPVRKVSHEWVTFRTGGVREAYSRGVTASGDSPAVLDAEPIPASAPQPTPLP